MVARARSGPDARVRCDLFEVAELPLTPALSRFTLSLRLIIGCGERGAFSRSALVSTLASRPRYGQSVAGEPPSKMIFQEPSGCFCQIDMKVPQRRVTVPSAAVRVIE